MEVFVFGDEQVISLQRTKVYVFSDSVLRLGKVHENPQSNTAWEDRLAWFKSSPEYRDLDRIGGEPMEFEWNIFPGFNTLQLSQEVKDLLLRLNETPENFTRRLMFNDISCGSRDNETYVQEEAARPRGTNKRNTQMLQREFVAATEIQKDGATRARMQLAPHAGPSNRSRSKHQSSLVCFRQDICEA